MSWFPAVIWIYAIVFSGLTVPMIIAAVDARDQRDAQFWARCSFVNIVRPMWIPIGLLALLWAWVRLAVKGV